MVHPWLVKAVIITIIAAVGVGFAANEMRNEENKKQHESPNEDSKRDDDESKSQGSEGSPRETNSSGKRTALATGRCNEGSVRRRGAAGTTTDQPSRCITPPPRTSSISSRENELQDEMSFLNALEQANEARRQQIEQEEREIASRTAELERKRHTLDRELIDFENRLRQLSMQSSTPVSASMATRSFVTSPTDSAPSIRPVTIPDEYSNPEVIWAASDDNLSSIHIGNIQLDNHPLVPTFPESSVDSSRIDYVDSDKSLQQLDDTDIKDIYVNSSNISIDDGSDDENTGNADDEHNETQTVSGKSMVSIDALSEQFSEDTWSHIGSD